MQKLLALFFVLFCYNLNAQFKEVPLLGSPAKHLKKATAPQNLSAPKQENSLNYKPIGSLSPFSIKKVIRAVDFDQNKMPTHIRGWLGELGSSIERQAESYLAEVAHLYQVEEAGAEWQITEIRKDEIGMQHIRVQQVREDVPIYSGELILHARNGRIESVMGRGFPSPNLETFTPALTESDVIRKVETQLEQLDHYVDIPQNQLTMLDMKQVVANLVIYHEDGMAEKERLAYEVQAYENLASYSTYFLDAHTGAVIHEHSKICKIHGDHELPPDGPKTANAQDLNGVNRTIDVYEVGGNYFMINATKPNFSSSQSAMPNEPVGVIWTLDANNSSPATDDFEIFHVANNNNASWNDKSSVSAHYNAGIAYDYFRNVHNRNAIDGGGGNIISFINVTDEDDNSMDNAFWNGQGMYYGNGNTEFLPLAGGLDVAGHEMSHGVVQSSANLEYQNESGALNESFADIFGAMMDREDYKIGEDVVTSAFPSGALRDLSNPNNGGSKLGDRGWQPKNVSEQYFGSLDNGGVHINSGIPNHAFYLYAEVVGKDKAEKVFYRALTEYLTRSSRFVDARNAVVQSAQDLFGSSEADAARNAFSSVGIGEGSGGDYTNDAMTNEGDQFLIYTPKDQSKLVVVDNGLEVVYDPASSSAPLSVPSVSDDGSLIYFVNANNQIESTIIDWTTGDISSLIVQDQQIWRNVVISKDGNRMAAVESAQENKIQIYDFGKQEWYTDAFGNFGFELYNPTFTEGVSTGDAKFADAMEFDISGEVLMYDVFSEIEGNFGEKIGYWDIGFMKVWDNQQVDWDEGLISKLFSNLSEGISVGNPTYSKNSPYIIAFDYIEGNQNAVIAANIETGDLGQIVENSSLGYPSYTGNDAQMVYTNESTFNTDIFVINLQDSKIQPVDGTGGEIVADSKWGTVFRNGTRVLSGVEDDLSINDIKVFPNPSSNFINFKVNLTKSGPYSLSVIDVAGRIVSTSARLAGSGEIQERVNISHLAKGQYTLILKAGSEQHFGIFHKQ